jgi:DNA-damage-inducible protein D
VDREIIIQLTSHFNEYSHKTEDGIEFWYARDLQKLLEYTKWANFISVIEKAKIACENARGVVADHFSDVGKPVLGGSGAFQIVEDLTLTRYACYLIAQNGDPRKETIAFAQAYFALQTRKQELLEQHLDQIERLQARQKLTQTETALSASMYQHGVDDKGFARIRSKGDESLFGGYSTSQMKQKLEIPQNRSLADFLPTITLKAKDFAGEITNFSIHREGLYGEQEITEEHVKNNEDVRGVLTKKNIYPEHLHKEEDIKKLDRRVAKEKEKSVIQLQEKINIIDSELEDSNKK